MRSDNMGDYIGALNELADRQDLDIDAIMLRETAEILGELRTVIREALSLLDVIDGAEWGKLGNRPVMDIEEEIALALRRLREVLSGEQERESASPAGES